MKGISGAGLDIQFAIVEAVCSRTDLHRIGFELIRAPVRVLEHGIVKVQGKTAHAVGDIQLLGRFYNARCLPLVVVGNRNGGIEVLCECCKLQEKDWDYYGFFHGSYILESLKFTWSRTSSPGPKGV